MLPTCFFRRLMAVTLFWATVGVCQAEVSSPHQQTLRNVILMIGDGMDSQQITIARNYLQGVQGQLLLDRMALLSAVQVLTVDEDDGKKPVYVADSANSATSMASGVITSRGRIATTAATDQDIVTIAEQAQKAGFATGIVTTSSVTDATPASFIAHVAVRSCHNPDIMQHKSKLPSWVAPEACTPDLLINGGAGSIAQQIALGKTDVVLGGGLKHFTPIAEGSNHKNLLQAARENGYSVLTQTKELSSVSKDRKLLGLFSPSTMPTTMRGEDGRIAEKPKSLWEDRDGKRVERVQMPASMKCEVNPDFVGVPRLEKMTETALSVLSAKAQKQGKGFFLMVESASIDKKAHARDPCGSIGEVQQLEEALALALAFAKQQSNTLVLVTADHGQAAQLIAAPSMYSSGVYSPGHVAHIETPEGGVMGVNYATNNFSYEEHTGVSVPLYSNSEGVGRIGSTITQPHIYDIMHRYLFE